MLKAKRPTDSSAGTKYRNPFWKSAHVPTAPPQVSEAETVKQSHKPAPSKPIPVAAPSLVGVSRSSQPQPLVVQQTSSGLPSASYPRQIPPTNSFNIVRSNPPQDARNAVSSSVHPPLTSSSTSSARSYASSSHHHHQHTKSASASIAVSKPEPSVTVHTSHAHRFSVQSLNSTNTASTSRSSFERISTENLQNSWGSGGTFSTAPSLNTDSLTRIPAASEVTASTSVDRQLSASRRFPLVESDTQRRHGEPSSSKTHGDTQGEQASDALPLPNSEYESPARVRSLRRSKPNINVSSTSVRVATSTTGRQTPEPAYAHEPTAVVDVQSPKPQEHHRSQSDMLQVAYVRRQQVEDVKGSHHIRDAMMARVLQTSSGTPRQTHQPSSTAPTRTMSTHTPRVATNSQPANPNMTKLKQTSIPRISTSGISTASPMIEQIRPLDSLQSPRRASADNNVASWTSVKSPTMTSAPAYSTLTSVVMSSNLSSVTSPRTLVSSSHPHTDVPPIQPSQHYYNLSSAGSAVGRSPIVESDYDSGMSTATPGTPTSHTVRALFSSLTSRSHRNSTPHPLRSSLSNPPITAPTEVDSPRVAPVHVLTPPPLPPQSTRPDAPQQSFAQAQNWGPELPPYSATSPRHGTVDLKSSTRASVEPRRDSASAVRPPSPNTVLRSYGLASGSGTQSPAVNAQKTLMGTPYLHSPRTLMSDSEVTTVTTSVVSVTKSTIVMPAGQQVVYGRSIERMSSAASRRESSVVSTTRNNQQSPSTPSLPGQAQAAANGGFFGMFRPKSPRHPFPAPDRASSPAPPPVPSKTPPPRSATASPSRRFGFSIPINLRHKPKKSISGASVEAVIGGERMGMAGESAMSSQGSLLQNKNPDPHYSEFPSAFTQTEGGRRLAAAMVADTDTEVDGGDDDFEFEEALELKMMAVEKWKSTTEGTFAMSGKRRSRPGVSFELPASESERDDTGMTAVSVAPGGGRILRYARTHSRQHQQFSDNESAVY